ncbi:hypothetical protein JW756_00760 [Candidatus Woesearchaeota archaeon]|nr:hypothetical protein [Candidatus Woesearchaeota archaeon]
MNILFVCKYNRFRSIVAESYFNKIMKQSGHKAKSAGIIFNIPIDEGIRKACSKFGLAIHGKPKGLNMNLLRWADMIVIVADDVPASIFDYPKRLGKKVIVWNIRDAHGDIKLERERIINSVQRKVDALAKSL